MSHTRKVRGEDITGVFERLAELAKEFASYRESTPVACRRRYPPELRSKVLAALDEGIPCKVILTACRITPLQLQRWKEEQGLPQLWDKGQTAPVRVFNIIPNPADQPVTIPSEVIEIRIGGWQLQLRLNRASPNRG